MFAPRRAARTVPSIPAACGLFLMPSQIAAAWRYIVF